MYAEFMIIGSKHNLTKIQTDSIIAITDETNNNIKGVCKIKVWELL